MKSINSSQLKKNGHGVGNWGSVSDTISLGIQESKNTTRQNENTSFRQSMADELIQTRLFEDELARVLAISKNEQIYQNQLSKKETGS
jgi:hypothetical protein